MKPLRVISSREKFDVWLLTMSKDEKNIIAVVNDGLKSEAIAIPGDTGSSFPAVRSVTQYLNAFGVMIAERIKNQFQPLFDPATEVLSPEILAVNEHIKANAGYSLYDAQLAVSEAHKRCLEHKKSTLCIAQLYNTYKELLDDMYLLQGHYSYPQFFLPDLLCEIMTLNRHDTVENPELTSLLDEDGYLTVYRGQVAERMRNANSCTLDRSMAIHVGRAYTLSSSSPTFYCVTGKVKLADVIAFLQGRKEHEVMVMQKNVKHKTKKMLNSEDY